MATEPTQDTVHYSEISSLLRKRWLEDSIREVEVGGSWRHRDLLQLKALLRRGATGAQDPVCFALLEHIPLHDIVEYRAYAALSIIDQVATDNDQQDAKILCDALLKNGWILTTALGVRSFLERLGRRVFVIIGGFDDHVPQRVATLDVVRSITEWSDGGLALCVKTADQGPGVVALSDPRHRHAASEAVSTLLAERAYKRIRSAARWQELLRGILFETWVDQETVGVLKSTAFRSPRFGTSGSPREAERTLVLLTIGLVDPGVYRRLTEDQERDDSPEVLYDFLDAGRWPASDSVPYEVRDRLNRLGGTLKDAGRPSAIALYDEFLSLTAVSDFLSRHTGRDVDRRVRKCDAALVEWLRHSVASEDEIAKNPQNSRAGLPHLPNFEHAGEILYRELADIRHVSNDDFESIRNPRDMIDLAEELRRVADALCVDEAKASGFRTSGIAALTAANRPRGLLRYWSRPKLPERSDAIKCALETRGEPLPAGMRLDGTIKSIRAHNSAIRHSANAKDVAGCLSIAMNAIEASVLVQDSDTNHILATFCAFAWTLQRLVTRSSDGRRHLGPSTNPLDLGPEFLLARRLSVWAELMVRQWERSEAIVPDGDNYYVFLSYKRSESADRLDSPAVSSIANRLIDSSRGAGSPYPFYDKQMGRDVGSDWVDGIFRWTFLAQCQVCLVSDDYFASDWCWLEFLTALIRAKLQPKAFKLHLVTLGSQGKTLGDGSATTETTSAIVHERRKLFEVVAGRYTRRDFKGLDADSVELIVGDVLTDASRARSEHGEAQAAAGIPTSPVPETPP